LNTKRKSTVATIVKEAKKRARQRFPEGTLITVLGDTAWKPALLGLAANSLMGDRGGVVCLWGRDASGNLKGSCRSDGSVSLSDLFKNAPDAFVQYGGHAHAGGFTVSPDRVHTLHEKLTAAHTKVTTEQLLQEFKELVHDATLALSTISENVLEEVSLLSPFGMGNPKPVFLIPEARITNVRQFGKQQNHIEVMLECAHTGRIVRAFDFFKQPGSFTQTPTAGTAANLLATLERDTFRSPSSIALRIVDVFPAV